MSILFNSKKVGPVEVKNRFVAAPIYEGMATEKGEVTQQLINHYTVLAKGGAGLIVTGFFYVNSLGRAAKFQVGIDDDKLVSGLEKITEAVHANGAKIFFELAHVGRWTSKELIGQTPMAPSAGKPDQVFRVKPRAMTDEDILGTINDFEEGARRARDAGADGIYVTGAGYSLFDQFLSPFLNKRDDEWGGSPEGRYRILGETIRACRKAMDASMALTVKINTNDFTPEPGVTPDLAKIYAGFLAKDGIDGLETSQGTVAYSSMNVWRGDVPVDDYVKLMPAWMRPIGRLMVKRWVGKYPVEEAWNLQEAKPLKAVIGDVPLFIVGGLRSLAFMEKTVEAGDADFVSIGRPLLREPNLVNKFQAGQTTVAACTSCNKCVGAILRNQPIACYNHK